MDKKRTIIMSFVFYLMSLFLVSAGLHSIDISQNMTRFSYFSLRTAVNATIQNGVPLTASIWETDMTALGNTQDGTGIYLAGIWLIILGAIFNFLGFFMLLEVKIYNWFNNGTHGSK